MILAFFRWLWLVSSWEFSGASRREAGERAARFRVESPRYDRDISGTRKRIEKRWERALASRDRKRFRVIA